MAGAVGDIVRVRAVIGILCVVAGAIWIAQGTGALHGSSMTGEGTWTVIGIVFVVVGAFLVLASWTSHRRLAASRGAKTYFVLKKR